MTLPLEDSALKNISSLSQQLTVFYELTPRQIEKVLKAFCQTISIQNQEKKLKSSWADAALILSVVKMSDKEMYHKLGRGEDNLTGFSNKISERLMQLSLTDDQTNKFIRNLYFKFIALAFGEGDLETAVPIFENIDGQKADPVDISRFITYYTQEPLLRGRPLFQRVYKLMEAWEDFIED